MSLMRHLLRFREDRRKLEVLIGRAIALRATEPHVFRAIIENVIVTLHDCWSCRCRDIVLASAVGKYVTKNGRQLSRVAALAGYGKPIEFLRHRWAHNKVMDRTWEPDWFIPQNAIRAAKLLGVANEAELTNGFGASTAPQQLRLTRNLIAHSLPNTWQRFRDLSASLGVAPLRVPAELAVSFDTGKGMRFVHVWLDELEVSLDLAIA